MTRMSSRGQVVIPEEIREALGLRQGANFVAIGSGNTIILKLISEPSMDQFDEIISDLRKAARKSGLKKSDINKTIKNARLRK